MRETRVQFLGQEDLLEKEMATHSNILAWKIPWMENLVGYSPWGCKESDTTERLHFPNLPYSDFLILQNSLNLLGLLLTIFTNCLKSSSLAINHEKRIQAQVACYRTSPGESDK